jgi:hypothetical protein
MGDDYTLEDALNLAWMLRGLPGQPRTGDRPTIAEAIEVIRQHQQRMNHTWLTGEKALSLLRAASE